MGSFFLPLEIAEELTPGLLGTPRTEAGRQRQASLQAGIVTKLEDGVMGFFSTLLNIGKTILGGVLGTAAVVAPKVVRPITTALPKVVKFGAPLAAGVAGGVAFAGGEALFAGGGTGMGGPGGNGLSFRRTIVQTVNSQTGEIIRQELLAGAPHIMNRDIQTAKRVFRLSGKLFRRLPKRTVRASRRQSLTEQVMNNALERAACPPALACPTKPC